MQSNLQEKSVLFTGSFELDPKRYAAQLGVTLATSVSQDVAWIVAGRTPSTIRLAQAQQLGIPQLDEAGFFEVVGLQDRWQEHEQAKAARQEEERRRMGTRESVGTKTSDHAPCQNDGKSCY